CSFEGRVHDLGRRTRTALYSDQRVLVLKRTAVLMLATWNKQLATALSKDGGPLTDNVVFSNVQRFPSKRLFLGNSFSHSFRKLQYLRD
ncbi:hypothetical protein, partial [Mesotoga sp. UBA5847]|uniref:hypothetical protein n=1 Tax=Mesotoga sp. UBA5847 TaxID=1946859 RepID=UPI0025EC1775